MGFWKALCTCATAAGAVCVCVATGGLGAPAIIGIGAASGFGGYLVGDKADKENAEREKLLMQDQRYKDGKNELESQENQLTSIKSQIDIINGKLNGTIPKEIGDTDESLRNKLIILTSQLNSGNDRISRLKSDLDKMRRELGRGSSLMSLLGLDKLSFTDKVLIGAGIVLMIWLIK